MPLTRPHNHFSALALDGHESIFCMSVHDAFLPYHKHSHHPLPNPIGVVQNTYNMLHISLTWASDLETACQNWP